MALIFNPFRRRQSTEHRQSYANAYLAAALDAALGETSTASAGAVAVVESCSSLIADPFLVARIDGRAIPISQLHQMARDVLRSGNSVWAIDVVDGELELQRACTWAVESTSPNPARWFYKLDIATPSAILSKTLPAESVIHLIMDAPAESPWQGRAPWQTCSLTGRAAAELEKSIGDESRIYAGRVWIAPDGSTQEQAQAMGDTVASLKGGKQVVAQTTSQGFGRGTSAAVPASKDWHPEQTGPNHPQGNALMRDGLENAIAGAYGIAPAYLNRQATAPALAAVKRLAFLDRTMPLAALIAEHLADKLASPGLRIHWPDLASQSVDVQLRAQALVRLNEAARGATPDMLELVGLPIQPMPATPAPTPEDARVPI